MQAVLCLDHLSCPEKGWAKSVMAETTDAMSYNLQIPEWHGQEILRTLKMEPYMAWVEPCTCSLQNKIWNLPDRSTIFPKFIYDKEGKLAGPTQILPVRVRSPALILKTVLVVKNLRCNFGGRCHGQGHHNFYGKQVKRGCHSFIIINTQRLRNYINQHQPKTASWLMFNTFLYQKNLPRHRTFSN